MQMLFIDFWLLELNYGHSIEVLAMFEDQSINTGDLDRVKNKSAAHRKEGQRVGMQSPHFRRGESWNIFLNNNLIVVNKKILALIKLFNAT